MKNRIPVAAAGVAAAALALAGCGTTQTAASSSGPSHGGVLNVATQTDVPSLDPAVGVDTESIQFVDSIFAQLVTYSPTSLGIVPDLASSWSYNTAKTELTLHLRKAEFSNGDPVTAQDVKFSITRVLNPKTSASLANMFMDVVGAQAYSAQKATSVTGLVVLSPTTIRIDLVKPEPYLLDALASGTASIMDPKVVAEYSKTISAHPVGAGAYMLKVWKPGQELVLVKNPHYWRRGLPYIPKIVMKIGMSPSSQFLAFQNGQLDIIGGALSDNLQIDQNSYLSALGSPKLKAELMTNTALEVYSLYLNAQMKPFTSTAVRQAMMYAVNRPALVKILAGVGKPANQLLPPGMAGYDNSLKAIPYNPAKAKSMLAHAGYPNGISFTLITMNDPTSINIAQAMQAEMAKAGIQMRITPEALSTYLNSILTPHTAQASYGLWLDDYPDPQDFLFNQYDGQNKNGFDVSYWDNAQVDALITAADTSTSQTERITQYQQAQKIILQNAPAVPLFYGVMDLMKSPNIHPSKTLYYLHQVLPIQFQYLYKN